MNAPSAFRTPASSWQISVGAEGIAAAQFARYGFDVSVQFGVDKPAYDMVVTKGGCLLKVAVNGSEDGTWNLTQSYVKRAAEMSGKRADFRGAIELWLDHHSARTVCCLVQFLGVSVDQLPRIYLATPKEVASKLRETAEGRGDSVLCEGNSWASSADGAENGECLPEAWRLSHNRIQEMLAGPGAPAAVSPIHSSGMSSARLWTPADKLSRASLAAIGRIA